MSKFKEKLKRQEDKYKAELLQMKLFEDGRRRFIPFPWDII